MPQASSSKSNLLAACILAATAGLLYASFNPDPAGENAGSESDRVASAVADFRVVMSASADGENEVPVLLPPEADEMLLAAKVAETPGTDEVVSREAEEDVSSPSQQALQRALELLEDGVRFMCEKTTYTATFHKQERLDGDLSEVQMIDMKVRQGDRFAVYMKWRNGDRGRQLLYSTEYDDGDMVVKLGGFKGRLLPGIRLNPNGSRALEESRHPVTQAGLLGMTKKAVKHRHRDLTLGDGVRCTQLPNQQFDERDCICFHFEYQSPAVHDIYRRCLLLIDGRDHIPVMARNYTWAADSDGLTSEELDERTLIENYSFTNIDFAKTLTAMDFSRENRRYRM